jgi:hypothetical protein
MTTIYLVSDGEYSDYSVYGLYSTLEKAKQAQELYAAGYIEEFELDYLPPHPPGELLWAVWMKDSGDIKTVKRIRAREQYSPFSSIRVLCEGWYPKTDGRRMEIWARDQEHATKIASEKRREMLVSGEWYEDDRANR